MKPYHPNNIGLTSYAKWQIIPLAWVAKLLGVQFHVEGMPFGGKSRLRDYDCDPVSVDGNGG